MSFRVEHVVSPNEKNPAAIARAQEFLSAQMATVAPAKRANYSAQGLDLEGHLAFALLLHDDQPIGCAGIYNGGRYPKGVYRIMNRSYLAPQWRSRGAHYSGLLSRHILAAQLELCRDHLRYIFVSREGELAPGFLRYWRRHLAPREFVWQQSDRLVHVAPAGRNRPCYQYIAYAELAAHDWQPESLDLAAWKALKDI